ncbi:MAG: hypothetical protein PHG40_03405 [Candidatus Omnitrophica bacterium]|nr:hypothetical protein [Candidatus Omnitrophota bacterium]
MNIFVGNLSFDAVEADVKKLFEDFGNVVSVVIVMSKEKKAPKSRGFGFVEMADDQQALDAIAALHEKEFMGRALNVEQARPKVEIQESGEPEDKAQPEVEVQEVQKEERKAPVRPAFKKPGAYRNGRRTHSYMKRQELSGKPVEEKPRWVNRDNPMRWRKRSDQPKPWQKVEEGGRKPPWQKASSERKPWQKTEGSSRPWKKPEGSRKPWQKATGERKPWQKAEEGSRPWKKPEGSRKPWQKAEEGNRTWKKPAGGSKPWIKKIGRGKPGGGYKRRGRS